MLEMTMTWPEMNQILSKIYLKFRKFLLLWRKILQERNGVLVFFWFLYPYNNSVYFCKWYSEHVFFYNYRPLALESVFSKGQSKRIWNELYKVCKCVYSYSCIKFSKAFSRISWNWLSKHFSMAGCRLFWCGITGKAWVMVEFMWELGEEMNSGWMGRGKDQMKEVKEGGRQTNREKETEREGERFLVRAGPD